MTTVNQSTNSANAVPNGRQDRGGNGEAFVKCAAQCLHTHPREIPLGTCSLGDVLVKRKTIPDELLVLMAEKFRMLGDPTRLAILRCLMEGKEQNVSQLVSVSGRELANVSKHLKQMADAGLLARRKEGSFVFYRLDDPVSQKICELVCDSLRLDLEAEIKRNQTFLREGRSK